jgi:hypothetical protein
MKLINNDDVDAALKQFRKACDYLDAHAHIFPSAETYRAQSFFNKALQVFSTSFHDNIN